ncbi:MAG: ATP-binding cassette domain-containing protein, partial [bacterium]|nr:ATP-binding cassette domain-containing protein [bacterium]
MLELINITKAYNNGPVALNDVSMKVKKGEFVFVVGPSGAGKSTLIKLLMCEERATAGQILVDGVDITNIRQKDIPYLRRQIGVVYQDFRLMPNWTVDENV